MAKNKNETANGASAKKAGKGGGSPLRSDSAGRAVPKNGAPSQTGNPYAGLTKLVGKVRARDPYSSESW